MDPFAPSKLGPVTLRNRFVKAATFEGQGDGRSVTDGLVDFHRTVAAGGVGLTTVAFCAVSPDGRGAPRELVMSPALATDLRRLTEAVDATGARAAIQLGHAGPVGTAVGGGGLAPSRVLALQAMRFTHAADEHDLARVVADFATAAELAVDAGFAAVELHFGHGYLVSAFLSPKLNRRRDRWGGTVAGRARLARTVAEAVRRRVGTEVAVTAKLNMADGVKGGLWLDDSVAAARLLEADGHLDALQLTGGSSFQNPMYLFRGDAPVAELAAAFPKPMGLALRLTARKFLPEYPFEEAFFLPYARQFRSALRMPLILLGGINRLDTVTDALAEGFDFVAMGRALLREPDLVARWQDGAGHEGLCVHCNKCMPTIYGGTHCVLVAPDERPGLR
ncbi:MAG: NADH:flavin oxidoreductase [Acidimicrobiia bacterium]|nr:NADH:flavin oxidoreductase [Acidimicrobiia bacterium]